MKKIKTKSPLTVDPLIETALNAVEITPEKIIKIAGCLNPEEQRRMTLFLAGKLNDVKVVPEKAMMQNRECTFMSYNWLTDNLCFSYLVDDVRFFKTKEAAEKFEKTNSYSWEECPRYMEDEIYHFKTTTKTKLDSYTNLETWINHALDDKDSNPDL